MVERQQWQQRMKTVPLQPGVYLFKDETGKVIYVGKARVLRNRLRSYFQPEERLDPKVRAMVRRARDLDYIVTASEVEALILECNLIKEYHPHYNIMLRDDKSYPYLKITTGDRFPRVVVTREKQRDNSRYFGPYTSAGALRETVKVLTSIFPLRTCATFKEGRRRPCLNFDLGLCPAPCTGRIDRETYMEQVNGLIRFLEGDYKWLIADLTRRMQEAAARLDFEQAALLRDRLNSVNQVVEKQQAVISKDEDLDLVAIHEGETSLALALKIRGGKLVGKDTFWLKKSMGEDRQELVSFFLRQYYSGVEDIPPLVLVEETLADREILEAWLKGISGHRVAVHVPARGQRRSLLAMATENARVLWEERYQRGGEEALISLARALSLEVVPERIECYDISHLGGIETVGSMVVAMNGRPEKSLYRRFKVKGDRNDDFASMRQVLERRLNEYEQGNEAFHPLPDLLVVDGGLGQTNTARQVLDERGYDLPVIGLAKKEEEIYFPGRQEPLKLPLDDEGLRLLARLRDEAHRFAITYNRQRREKKARVSVLDNIPGIGEKRRQALIQHLGSVKEIREASVEQLSAVPGMNAAAARAVWEYFHPGG